jgi:glycosyltransferase involved in cell wall biosynthesis
MIKLALVGDFPLDPSSISNGPQAVFVYLLNGLKKLPGLDIHVVTAKKQINNEIYKKTDAINYYYLPYPRLPAELSFRLLRSKVHDVLNQIQPELVHGQSGHRYGAICLGSGYPNLLTCHNVHGAEVPFTSGKINQLRLSFHFSISRRYFEAHAKHIVSISPYIKENYQSLKNVCFYEIDNPISDTFFRLNTNKCIPSRILFIGMIRKRKRPDLAVKALKILVEDFPQIQLYMVGAQKEPQLFEQLMAFVDQNNLNPNIRFLGHMNETDILGMYESASVFLLTSDLETSPMVVQQALAAGKPVVVTDGGGTKYLVEEGKNGYIVERNNPQEIADALKKFLKNESMRKQFGLYGRKVAMSRFKSEVVAEKMLDAYNNVISDEKNRIDKR